MVCELWESARFGWALGSLSLAPGSPVSTSWNVTVIIITSGYCVQTAYNAMRKLDFLTCKFAVNHQPPFLHMPSVPACLHISLCQPHFAQLPFSLHRFKCHTTKALTQRFSLTVWKIFLVLFSKICHCWLDSRGVLYFGRSQSRATDLFISWDSYFSDFVNMASICMKAVRSFIHEGPGLYKASLLNRSSAERDVRCLVHYWIYNCQMY